MSNDAQKNDDWKQRMQDELFRNCTFSNDSNSLIASELDFLDRAALAAIHGDIAQGDFQFRTISEGVAHAYNIAEAMLAERNRRRANRGT